MKGVVFAFVLITVGSCHLNNGLKVQPVAEDNSIASPEKEINRNDSTSGIIYTSADDGLTWQNKSKGLPDGINLTDFTAWDEDLIAATKEHGLFIYNSHTGAWSNVIAPQQVKYSIDVVIVFNNNIFIGTQDGGVIMSADNGVNWKEYNKGLLNRTIRRFAIINDSLYAGTNEGLYVLNEKKKEWLLKFTEGALQVNGISALHNDIFIGTNKGVYKSGKPYVKWQQVLREKSLHNIAVENNTVFAMVYNELFVSADQGATWRTGQNGMPANKYSFHVKQKSGRLFIAQWDGVYAGNGINKWQLSVKGMPHNFPVTELVVFKNNLVAASSVWFNETTSR
ncbi:MAG: hypothetical protein V4717_06175 [Bacteroidota bacterium]